MSHQTWGNRVNDLWIASKIGVRNSRFVTVYVAALHLMTRRYIDLSDDRKNENVSEIVRDRSCEMLLELTFYAREIILEINRIELAGYSNMTVTQEYLLRNSKQARQ